MNIEMLNLFIRIKAVLFMLKGVRNQILVCVLTVEKLDTLFRNSKILSNIMLSITASLLFRNNLLVLTTVTIAHDKLIFLFENKYMVLLNNDY